MHRQVEAAGFGTRLGGGLVLTGGMALVPGIGDLASEVFGSGVRIGVPTDRLAGLADTVESPRYATVVGLAQYAAARLTLGSAGSSAKRMNLGAPGVDKLGQRVKTWLQDFF